jgi:hypothetical protein
LIKDGAIHPIDFANACPDSNFTSLHVHFPWLICSLVKWISFCTVTQKDMRIDMQQNEYLDVLNDPNVSALNKYKHAAKVSREYFNTAKFQEFCAKNFADIEDKMIEYYDKYFDQLIAFAIQYSDFPEAEQERFYYYYKDMMAEKFRPNADQYLRNYMIKK